MIANETKFKTMLRVLSNHIAENKLNIANKSLQLNGKDDFANSIVEIFLFKKSDKQYLIDYDSCSTELHIFNSDFAKNFDDIKEFGKDELEDILNLFSLLKEAIHKQLRNKSLVRSESQQISKLSKAIHELPDAYKESFDSKISTFKILIKPDISVDDFSIPQNIKSINIVVFGATAAYMDMRIKSAFSLAEDILHTNPNLTEKISVLTTHRTSLTGEKDWLNSNDFKYKNSGSLKESDIAELLLMKMLESNHPDIKETSVFTLININNKPDEKTVSIHGNTATTARKYLEYILANDNDDFMVIFVTDPIYLHYQSNVINILVNDIQKDQINNLSEKIYVTSYNQKQQDCSSVNKTPEQIPAPSTAESLQIIGAMYDAIRVIPGEIIIDKHINKEYENDPDMKDIIDRFVKLTEEDLVITHSINGTLQKIDNKANLDNFVITHKTITPATKLDCAELDTTLSNIRMDDSSLVLQ